MNSTNKAIIAVICIAAIIVLPMLLTGKPDDINAKAIYNCDVKNFNLNTKIEVSQNDTHLYTIQGDILRIVEDPLTMYSDGKKIAYAGDTYHLINQDSHSLYMQDKSESYEVVGDFNWFGNSYSVYKGEDLIATAEFNGFNTSGKLLDTQGNLIADYTSNFEFNDYCIQIVENDLFSDEMLLMIFASYYSDQSADS